MVPSTLVCSGLLLVPGGTVCHMKQFSLGIFWFQARHCSLCWQSEQHAAGVAAVWFSKGASRA